VKPKEQRELVERLRSRREAIFAEVADAERDLASIAEDRESELEERAQRERAARLLARLDDVGKREIEEIDEALRRVSAGTYGICESCQGAISRGRLEAVPAARLCIDCAREEEAAARSEVPRVAEPIRHPGRLPADLEGLSGPDVEAWLRDLVREDGRIDQEELRVVCRHGVVYLDGTLPSEAEHQILLGIVRDLAGLIEVVDRLEIREVPWQREDRAPGLGPSAEGVRQIDSESGTEDVVASLEEGLPYAPPGGPTPEEE
jgi:DnaK suppressor protein